MPKINMTEEVGQLITSTASKKQLGVNAMQTAIPVLMKHGVISTKLISPKTEGSTATPEEWSWINTRIVLSFTKPVQKLLDTPTKSLTDVQKTNKRYWQMQIGGRRGDFKSALIKREDGGDGSGGKPKPADIRVKLKVNECLTIIDKVADETQLVNGEQIKSLFKQVIALLPK